MSVDEDLTICALLFKELESDFVESSEKAGMNCKVYGVGPGQKLTEEFEENLLRADIIVIQETTTYLLSHRHWQILSKRAYQKPVVLLGKTVQGFYESCIKQHQIDQINKYYSCGGRENLYNLLLYLKNQFFDSSILFQPPINLPRSGIYSPKELQVFSSTDDYLASQKDQISDLIGILFDRSTWVTGNLLIENSLIAALKEKGFGVIPVFTDYSKTGSGNSTCGIEEVIRTFFLKGETPRVTAIIKLTSALSDPSNPADEGKENLTHCLECIKKMNIPVFQPVVTYYQSLEEWQTSKGLTDDVPWAIALPEYEGVIEPVMIGSFFEYPDAPCRRIPIEERCKRVADRISRWVRLCQKPRSERRVVLMLNNSPCHGVEATVGSASHMNGLQSVVKLLNRFKDEGYTVNGIPDDGAALIKTILERRALCEFRWTTVQDVISKGGAIAQIPPEKYNMWFTTLDGEFRKKVTEMWGEPPGEAMVYNGNIVVTGVPFGNILVCCQPKRGCYGPKCDGKVCKILHDPTCPPPHQYLATYHYLEEDFDADVLIHVGTHGSLELTPGKGAGMSRGCSPDVCIGNIPYLYIYNANNPAEGALSKRRTYATLIDHMLSVMDQSALYEKLDELDGYLNDYETVKEETGRRHELEQVIRETVKEINLEKDMHLSETDSFDVLKGKAHEVLSKIRNTQIVRDVHIFGEIPEGEREIEFINNIIRFDVGDECIRRIIAELRGLDFDDLFDHQDRFSPAQKKSYGKIIEELDEQAKSFIKATLDGEEIDVKSLFGSTPTEEQTERLWHIQERIKDLKERLCDSKEIEALLNGMNMGHIPPGPSGYLSRGQDEVLPTGRNFYSTDPYRTPTKSAWKVGVSLANSLLEKYKKEEGILPENIGYYWMAMDMMCSNGEGFAQLMYLLGVEPVWNSSGQVRTFSVIPLEKLGRPRIDVTVEITSTLRDCYPNCYEMLDQIIQTVAGLDEPAEMNYVRKHALMSMHENGNDWRNSTLRIFSNPPGVYISAVGLAVHASAWETEKDLVDVFMATHGFAYGKKLVGSLEPEQFARNLATVNVTFDKTASDSGDLLGCCCFFSNHGGMTTAARHFSPNEVKVYYGDTREPDHAYVHDMADEVRRVMRAKMFNPKWIESMKKAGYNGAAAVSTRTEHLMGWQTATGEIDDWIFDEITRRFVIDPEMKEFFQEKNPYAFEELTRRLLETEKRGLWDADPEALEKLKNTYLEVESWLEDDVGEGEHQGGSVDIITARDVDTWGKSIQAIAERIDKKDLYHFLSVKTQ